MSKFNAKVTNKTTNLAGGRAFSMDSETELVHAVLNTFLEDKFYESGDARLERIKELVKKCDPQFVANLAIIARKEFHLRSVTTMLLGELAKNYYGNSTMKDTIIAATERVDDLTELVTYCGTPLPKQVKRGVRNALLKFNRYQLAKYRGEGKAVSLVDLFNLTHPKPQHANDEQRQAWDDLINGRLVSFDTWETEVSNAKDEAARKLAWETLVMEDKLGYMALIRNLNNLVKYDVSSPVKKYACKLLTSPELIKKSKQLPFRFYTAYENVQGERKFADAISEAMDIAVSNTPELPGKTLIAIDSSGSMTSNDCLKKAAIFGATLFKSNQNAEVILYDTNVYKLGSVSGRTPVVDLVKSVLLQSRGGGTDTSLVFKYSLNEKKKFDRIIIISDNESWVERYGSSVQSCYNDYKAAGNDPYIYAIDIAGYNTKDVTGGKVFHLAGWSNRLLDFIGRAEQGDGLVKYVREYQVVDKKVDSEEEEE